MKQRTSDVSELRCTRSPPYLSYSEALHPSYPSLTPALSKRPTASLYLAVLVVAVRVPCNLLLYSTVGTTKKRNDIGVRLERASSEVFPPRMHDQRDDATQNVSHFFCNGRTVPLWANRPTTYLYAVLLYLVFDICCGCAADTGCWRDSLLCSRARSLLIAPICTMCTLPFEDYLAILFRSLLLELVYISRGGEMAPPLD